MGWSCSQKASVVLRIFSSFCVTCTGNSNTYTDEKGNKYFIETSRKEHEDGAITGTLMKMISETHCRASGSIRINGDGTIARGNKYLKNCSELAAKFGYSAKAYFVADFDNGLPDEFMQYILGVDKTKVQNIINGMLEVSAIDK